MSYHARAGLYRALLWLRPILAMTTKELRQLVRDRALFFFILYIFTLNIVIAAGEGSTELNQARLVVHDGDRSAASRELIYRFRQPYFRLSREVSRPEEALRMLEAGEARLFLDIPGQFERDLQRGERPAAVQVLVDTSKANAGFLASAYSAQIAAGFGREVAAARLGGGRESLPVLENERRIWYNPALNQSWFSTIAELLSMITVACILLPASALIREKERGTIEQLLVSPLSPLQIMLPKVFAMVLVTVAGAAVSLFLIMIPLYHVPTRGSLPLFFLLTALYAFANAGLGLASATFTRSSGQVGMLVLLIVMPMLMLSGIRTPLESMPAWLRFLIQLNPLTHYIETTYGILLRGAGLALLWDSILAMALLGGALFGVGVWRFRRQLG